MTFQQHLDRLGFDRARLTFTLRTALASWLALVAASALHLDSPHWAAMTVWVVSQPSRGMLLEKGLYRLLGTMAGAVIGALMLQHLSAQPPLLVVALAGWIAICAATGNLLRHFRAYGALLAGYTAAMVALIDISHPEHVTALAVSRVACVFVGIVVATIVGWLLGRGEDGDDLTMRVRAVAAEALRWGGCVLDADEAAAKAELRTLVAEMAAIEDILDATASGSRRGHQRSQKVRRLLAALLSLMAEIRAEYRRRADATPWPGNIHAWMGLAAESLAAGRALPVLPPMTPSALADVAQALAPLLEHTDTIAATPSPLFVFHRDWSGAGAAALRAATATLAVGAIWLLSDWQFGPFMLMGTCIMATLFSSFDDPAMVLRKVLIGSAAGAALALGCQVLVLTHVPSHAGMVLALAPFLALGGLGMANRLTAQPAMDYNMCFLLLVRPIPGLAVEPAHMAGSAIAVLAGIMAALAAFHFVLPVNGTRRLHGLMIATITDLERLADGGNAAHARLWRPRLHHRILRLVRRVDLLGGRDLCPVDGGIAALGVGDAIDHLRRMATTSPDQALPIRRRLSLTLARLARLSRQPLRAANALDNLADHLSPDHQGQAPEHLALVAMLRDAALGIRNNPGFFSLNQRG